MIKDPKVSSKQNKDESPRIEEEVEAWYDLLWGSRNTQGAAHVKYTGRRFQLNVREESNNLSHTQLAWPILIDGELPVTGGMQAQAGELQPVSC